MKKQAKEKNNNKNKKKKNNHIFAKVVVVLLLIIAIAAGIFIYKVNKNGGGLQGVLKTSLGHDEDTVNNLEKIYCLLLGQSQNLTDTIMVASYDPKTQEAALLSIPRDTFVGDNKNYATGFDKINAIYQTGVENLLEDVREITGINVKYYLKVDTEALRALVDEIGGVYFDVPIDMDYDAYSQDLHIHLKAGYQLLDGDKAEQVVRFRHNNDYTTYPAEYGGEDLGRMKTQRAFLTAVFEQAIQKMDINTIFGFLDIAEQYVETNLNFDAIKDYVPYIIDFDIDTLKTATLPGIAEQSGNGVWIYSVYEDEAKDVIDQLFYGASTTDETNTNTIDGETTTSEAEEETKDIKVEVLNGSGTSAKLEEVVSELEASGFDVIQTGSTTKTSKTIAISRIDLTETNSNQIKEILDINSISNGSKDGELADVTIIIGTDYIV